MTDDFSAAVVDGKPRYLAKFSHEYEADGSSPARSYWDICYGTDKDARLLFTVCLHHRASGAQPELTAADICWQLHGARATGRHDKLAEIRRTLGLAA